MKKLVACIALLSALVLAASAAMAEPEIPTVGGAMLVTPFGQSQDGNFVNLLAKRNSLPTTYDLHVYAKDVDWSQYKILVCVLGGSGKGLGAAGLDIAGEVARCDELLAQAKANGIYVVGMHIGGPDRRGPNSEAFVPYAAKVDLMLVRSDGNEDGYFTDLCGENNVPLVTIEKTTELQPILKTLCGVE